MNPPAVIAPQPNQVAPSSDGANPSDDLAAALYILIRNSHFLRD